MKISLVVTVLSILVIVGPISVESRYKPQLKICQRFESKEPQHCQKSGFIFLWRNSCSFECSNQGGLFLNCTKVFGILSDEPKCADILCVKKEGNSSTSTSTSPTTTAKITTTSTISKNPSNSNKSSDLQQPSKKN